MQLEDEKAKQEQEAAQQVRIQAQEEKVATLSLPYDFNELYGDSTANDSIVEVVQIFLREANNEHNDEVQRLIEAHREEMRAANDRELQLKRQNDNLDDLLDNANVVLGVVNEQLAEEKQAHDEVLKMLNTTKLQLNDALAKRDAAVTEKEGIELMLKEKQEHIDKLRDEMAIGASRAINVINVNPSDRLAALVEQSKSAKIKSSIELALERTEPIRGKIDVVAPPKALGEAVPSVTVANGLDNSQTSGIPADHQEVVFPELPRAEAPSVPAIPTAMVEGKPTVEVAGKTLEERVIELEKAVFGKEKEEAA